LEKTGSRRLVARAVDDEARKFPKTVEENVSALGPAWALDRVQAHSRQQDSR